MTDLQIDSEIDVEQYGEQGYLIRRDLLTTAEVDGLIAEAAVICRGQRGDVGRLPATSPADTDDEVLSRVLAIHHPHKISPLFTQALAHPKIAAILGAIVSPNVKCMQSLLFVKGPGMPGQAWHQDEIPIPTRDRSLTGVWMALDDARIDNGCLWVIAGSHGPGVLYERKPHADPRFDGTHEAQRIPYADDDATPAELARGSVLFFNGYLLHRSINNTTTNSYRRALVCHYMSAESYLPWHGEEDHRDIVMVAGTDPYAYKGTVRVNTPHVRARERSPA